MTAKELGDKPAYPEPVGSYGGLTKREAMAMAAMTGLLSFSPPGVLVKYENQTAFYSNMALSSVQLAEALLAELAKEKP